MNYRESLKEKGVVLRPAQLPNPAQLEDGFVRVFFLNRAGSTAGSFLVDVGDYEQYVRPFRWNVNSVTRNRVYSSAHIPSGSGNSSVLLARFLMDPPQGAEIDHVNLDPLDNRRSNLRVVTRKENEENRPAINNRGRSSFRGVHFDSTTERWRAEVMHFGKRHKSPRFDSESEAIAWVFEKRAELYTHNDGDRQ